MSEVAVSDPQSTETQSTVESTQQEPVTEGGDSSPVTEPTTTKTEADEEGNHDQRRWKRLIRERTEAQVERDALRAALAKYQQPEAPQPQAQKPVRASYANEAEYIDALTDWKIEERLPRHLAQHQQATQQSSAERDFVARENTVKAELKDYDDVIADAAHVVIPTPVAHAILTSEFGPDLRYYLATHIEEAEALNKLSPEAALRTIGRIEAKVEMQVAARKVKPAAKVTGAPPPIKPVGASAAPVAPDLNSGNMTTADWMKQRNTQINQRYKR